MHSELLYDVVVLHWSILPISSRVTSLAPGESYDHTSIPEAYGKTNPLITVRCRYNVVNFLQNSHNRGGRGEDEVWGVCCEFEVWLTFYCCRRSALHNIVINWTALKRHSTNWKRTTTKLVCIYMRASCFTITLIMGIRIINWICMHYGIKI